MDLEVEQRWVSYRIRRGEEAVFTGVSVRARGSKANWIGCFRRLGRRGGSGVRSVDGRQCGGQM